jgi:hypothetical protein
VHVTFSPQRPGYHIDSIRLPPDGVNGLGIPTIVTVRDGLRLSGTPTADVPGSNLRIAELNVNLPVYPPQRVSVTVPVRRTGDGQPEVLVTYWACSATTCLPPVRNRPIILT